MPQIGPQPKAPQSGLSAELARQPPGPNAAMLDVATPIYSEELGNRRRVDRRLRPAAGESRELTFP
jgi:hypothetical protein